MLEDRDRVGILTILESFKSNLIFDSIPHVRGKSGKKFLVGELRIVIGRIGHKCLNAILSILKFHTALRQNHALIKNGIEMSQEEVSAHLRVFGSDPVVLLECPDEILLLELKRLDRNVDEMLFVWSLGDLVKDHGPEEVHEPNLPSDAHHPGSEQRVVVDDRDDACSRREVPDVVRPHHARSHPPLEILEFLHDAGIGQDHLGERVLTDVRRLWVLRRHDDVADEHLVLVHVDEWIVQSGAHVASVVQHLEPIETMVDCHVRQFYQFAYVVQLVKLPDTERDEFPPE